MPLKRAAPTNTTEGNDAKKSKPQEKGLLHKKLDILSDAFNNPAYEFPCRQDLKQILSTTMSTPVEERHEFQTQAFGMVEEAVGEASQTLETRKADLENQVSSENVLKENMEKDLADTIDAVEKAEVKIEALDKSMDEAAQRLVDGETRLKAEELVLKEASVDYDKHQADYTELDTAFVDLYCSGVKEFIDEDARPEHKTALDKVLNKFFTLPENEATVLESVFPALYKDPSTRTKFDTFTLDCMEDHIENTLFAIKKKIEETTPDFSTRDSLIQEVARLTHEFTDEQYKLHAAKATKKELLTKRTSIEKSLKNHPKKVKHVESELQEVVRTIECYNATVVPANKFLQEYTEEVVPEMCVKQQSEEIEEDCMNVDDTIVKKDEHVMEHLQQEGYLQQMRDSEARVRVERTETLSEMHCHTPQAEPAFRGQTSHDMRSDSEEDVMVNESRCAGANLYEVPTPVSQGTFHGNVEQEEFVQDQMNIGMDIVNSAENTPTRNVLDSPRDNTIKSNQGNREVERPTSFLNQALW